MTNVKRLRVLIDFAVHVISKTCILNSSGNPNTWNLCLNPDAVYVEVNLLACCKRFHALHQYTSLKKHVGLSFSSDAPRICNDLPDV